MKFSNEQAKPADEAINAGPEPVPVAPADKILRAAHT
jgi:hypothetical protein